MACSSMIKDIYLLKAFESGADGVIVVGCPAGKCKRVDGDTRAAKRVAGGRGIHRPDFPGRNPPGS